MGRSRVFGGQDEFFTHGQKDRVISFSSLSGVCSHLYFFFSMRGQVGSCMKTQCPDTSVFFFSMRKQVESRTKTRRPDTSTRIGCPGASSSVDNSCLFRRQGEAP